MKTPISNSSSKDDDTIPEIYYIIQRFLSLGPCSESAELLKREIEQCELLPKRFDHRGRQHRRTFDEYDTSLRTLIPDDFLKRICEQTTSLVDLIAPPGVSNIKKSLFCGGKQSVLRTKDFCPQRSLATSTVWLKNGQPQLLSPARKIPHLDHILFGREYSGRIYNKSLSSDFLISRMELQTRIFGHLSSIFCVAFDRSGLYIFTGADDNLIKVWSAREGRLLYTFRGFSGEITDLTVSHENTLLAAGSCDKTIRVWCLRTATPVAVLQGHSAMVTSLQFLPYVESEDRWLVSTGNDCCVCFWKWNIATNKFNPVPIKYQERLRVGGQMICSSHSPGGRFIATGGTDHFVRVYVMRNGWPERVIETEGHTDRVDSVQWAHRGLRFLTGSRDGVAKIWTFERQTWKTIPLIMTLRYDMGKDPVAVSSTDNKTQRLKVTMVTWSMHDTLVVTAVSDHTLRVWDSKDGTLLKCLFGHTDEVFVLEPHPVSSKILLSAGHDGNLYTWNVVTGESTKKYFNAIEGLGHGAFFDARFSIDGENLAAVDSHGHLSIFGADSNEIIRTALREQFFHTDYRPLLRDHNHYVVDEQTQVAPHLMPPPFLVNSDGDPHPPALQRRVPGKENCSDAFLIPVVVRNPDRDSNEIIDVVSVSQPSTPAPTAPAGVAANDAAETGEDETSVSTSNNSNSSRRPDSSTAVCAWASRPLVRPLHPSVLEQSVKTRRHLGLEEITWYETELAKSPLPVFVEQPKKTEEPIGRAGRRKPVNHAYGMRSNPRQQRPHSGIVPTPQPPPELNADAAAVVAGPETSGDDSDYSDSDESTTSSVLDASAETSDPDYSDIEANKPRTRRTAHEEEKEEEERKEEKENIEDDGAESVSATVVDEIAPKKAAKKEIIEDDFSDQKPCSSKDVVRKTSVETSSRPKRSRLTRKELYIPENLDEIRNRRRTRRVSLANEPTSLADVPEKFLFPDWITCTTARKTPYFPQIRDEIIYFPTGHRLYVEAVERLDLYPVHRKSLPWNRHDFHDEEFALVVGVRFEIVPVRLCCLKLAQLHWKTGKKTGLTYTVRYHDIPNVVDFIVLRQYYDQSVKRKWKPGDRFQAIIDDGWWFGTVMKKEAFDSDCASSHFQCFVVLWDNGEEEKLSPWDLEPFESTKCPTKKGAMVPVTPDELVALASYQSKSNEWPAHGMDVEISRICAGIEKIMAFSLAEPFVAPVDLNAYPTYCLCVEYPSDLSTIKSRLENKFYRRLEAAEQDIRQIGRNASTFNEPKSQIVQQARTLTDVLLRYLEEFDCDDVVQIYNDEFNRSSRNEKLTTTTDDEKVENSSQTKCARRRKYISTKYQELPSIDGKEWIEDCREIVGIFQSADQSAFVNGRAEDDSENSALGFTDESLSMKRLKSIVQKLDSDEYENPQEFESDMSSLLNTMKVSNSNKRSKAYLTTIKLRGQYLERIKPILDSWKQKSNSKPLNGRVYNTRKRDRWNNNNNENYERTNKIELTNANNMIQAYHRAKNLNVKPSSAPVLSATTPERRRVIVAGSDDSDENCRPSTSAVRQPPPVYQTTPSKTKSSSIAVVTTTDHSSTLLPTTTTTISVLPKRSASQFVNYNENFDDDDYRSDVSSNSTKKRRKTKNCGVNNKSSRTAKSSTLRSKNNDEESENNDDDDDEEEEENEEESASSYDEEIGRKSLASNNKKRRRSSIKKRGKKLDPDYGSENDGDDDERKLELANPSTESDDVDSAETTGRKRRRIPSKSRSSSSTTKNATERPKRRQLTSLKRKLSSSSRESDVDRKNRSTVKSKTNGGGDQQKNQSANANCRTRFGGKRVVHYAETGSEEENENGEPKIVLSTSSRGRVCKLRKFS